MMRSTGADVAGMQKCARTVGEVDGTGEIPLYSNDINWASKQASSLISKKWFWMQAVNSEYCECSEKKQQFCNFCLNSQGQHQGLWCKAKAKAKDSAFKAKAKDLGFKAKAKAKN